MEVHERIEKAKPNYNQKDLDFYSLKCIRTFKDCRSWIIFENFFPPF